MKEYKLDRLIVIATALSVERDIDMLLEFILLEAMDITSCDGGTVYTLEDGYLSFRNMITKSKNVYLNSGRGEIKLPPIPLGRTHVCACSALDKKKINIPDVYLSEEYDFAGAQKYDALNDYRTKSMLVLPMEDDQGDVIGVLQLINAMDDDGEICPFPEDCERLISALSSLAAVSLNNSQLSQEVYDILHSFVRVMVGAIDTRSSYNANHTKSMVRYGERFLQWLDETNSPYKFPERAKDPFIMSIWLHDIGKLVIPLSVMDKATRLGRRKEKIMHRIEVAILMDRVRQLEDPARSDEAGENIRRLKEARDLILKADEAGFLEEETVEGLKEAAGLKCFTSEGEEIPLLNEDELEAITIRKGTLTAAERRTMEEHVVQTAKMLEKMKFRGIYAGVPKWAAAHHELLDGSGYPEGRRGEEISTETRIITILDIYDALTAEDRPYKPPMSPEKSFVILHGMADEGKLDKELLTLFEESRAWVR